MKSGFEAIGRMRFQAILLLAVAFGIGVLAGFAVERTRSSRWSPRPPGMRPPDGLPLEMVRDLQLTPEQEQQVTAILDEYRPRIDAVLDEFFPKLRALTDSARAEIRTVLTPEQQAIFDREQPRAFEGMGPPPFGGGRTHGRPRPPSWDHREREGRDSCPEGQPPPRPAPPGAGHH